ncbi:MAG: DUF881 domain-containing protein [Actinomycetota bacterium]|nr:DUF881 domain-containing protein [Actinomycetota bacterium]
MSDPTASTGGGEKGLYRSRVMMAVGLALLAALLVVAARAAARDERSRLGRRVELVELIRAEQQRVEELSATVEGLSSQVTALERRGARGAQGAARLRGRIERVAAAAGMTGVRGPGVVARLTDSSLGRSPRGDPNDLVIHESDLQGVINALWAGGAEAISVNGQRILATTAIRCVGNTLLLHQGVYSPPYVVRAIGDSDRLRRSLEGDPAVSRFQIAAEQYKLGFTVADRDAVAIPAYRGPELLLPGQPPEA